jgi:ADP-ribosyl-[dinitrogen reductase] hydrolase
LGAPLEFSPVSYTFNQLQSMGQTDIWDNPNYNSFQLKSGQWTDDASMGLCLADSLLVNKGFSGVDLRLRFLRWWQFGYNNAFGHDNPVRNSVGLGGNISESFMEFLNNPGPETKAGNLHTSGNGSIMRLAPVPVFYCRDLNQGLAVAYKQSKATHQGDEAAECCRLMTLIITSFINSDISSIEERKKHVLTSVCSDFESNCYGVHCLARSQHENPHPSNQRNISDRNWNWKQSSYHYSESRATEQPGYIGSYAMDALSMALHCVWTTTSFRDALLKVVNLRGDSDSTGSVTAQIAGSLYGVYDIPADWIAQVQQWDNGGRVALTAYWLYHSQKDLSNSK